MLTPSACGWGQHDQLPPKCGSDQAANSWQRVRFRRRGREAQRQGAQRAQLSCIPCHLTFRTSGRDWIAEPKSADQLQNPTERCAVPQLRLEKPHDCSSRWLSAQRHMARVWRCDQSRRDPTSRGDMSRPYLTSRSRGRAGDDLPKQPFATPTRERPSNQVSNYRHRQQWTLTDDRSQGQACRCAGQSAPRLGFRRRGGRFKSGHPGYKAAGHTASDYLRFAFRLSRCPILGARGERTGLLAGRILASSRLSSCTADTGDSAAR